MDQRFSVLVEEREDHEDSEAKKIREAWLKRNAEGEASACEDELAREDLPPVIETALSPRKPKVVREHTPPPLSPSRAEFTTTEAMHLDNVFGMEPTDVPLPESPAGPGSIRSGRSKAVGSPIEADERVSRWLLSTPTASPSKGSTSSLSGHENAAEEDANSLLATPSGKGRKDRPAHISILSVQSSSAPSSPRSQKSVLPPLPNSPPLESEDPRSPRTASVPTLSVSPATPSPHRGRSAATIPIPMTPALSPTRTASSSFTSESPLTPTTLSAPSSTSHAHRMRKSSMTSGESHSSEGPSRQSYVEDQKTRKMEAVDESGVLLMSNVATVILESPVEDEQVADIPTSPLATPLPRTPRPGDREGAGRKKSGLFGKRAADEVIETLCRSICVAEYVFILATTSASFEICSYRVVYDQPAPFSHWHYLQQATLATEIHACG
ncbi:hypothetical protein EW026_g4535 [Hermanssonia centrifuga]|uniref:Uncharacterized protein n=1 Tax=Hermanssonia centrifuga TaxID=98765 RepID=A0A4S4KHX5_9APHY|nr:hypothetical protein EW026_g4535 [Hermanssonia centrifuga]